MVGPCQSRALHLQIHAVAQVVAHLIEHKDCAAISRRLRPRRARARADEVQLQNPGKDEEATKHLNRQGIMSVRKQRARGSTLFFCFSIIISSSSSIIIHPCVKASIGSLRPPRSSLGPPNSRALCAIRPSTDIITCRYEMRFSTLKVQNFSGFCFVYCFARLIIIM